jgi:hypothetical protein
MVQIELDWDMAAQPGPNDEVEQQMHPARLWRAKTAKVMGVWVPATHALLGCIWLELLSVNPLENSDIDGDNFVCPDCAYE